MNNWRIQDNIWAFGNYGIGPIGNAGGCDTAFGWGSNNFYGILNACVTGWTVDHNAVFNWNGGTLGKNWPTDGAGAGNFFFLGSTTIGFTNYGTGDSKFNPQNYQLTSTSPLHNKASDGKDIGADIATLVAKIKGVRE